MTRDRLISVWTVSTAALVLSFNVFAASDNSEKMTPTGTRCAGIGELCTFSGTKSVHIAGCKSIDRYNGGCSSSRGVIATGSIRCTLATFGLKAPLPNVGVNACYYQSLEDAGITESSKRAVRKTVPKDISGAKCTSAGLVTVDATIVVNKGVYDGLCKTYSPGSRLKRSAASEQDKPLFRLENGATLKNVIMGDSVGDDEGIHIQGGATLDNIRWTKFRDKAVTVKTVGNVSVKNFSASNGKDRLFQVDAPTTIEISNCVVDGMRKMLSQAPKTTFAVSVFADRCQLSNISTAVFVSDSPNSVAKLTKSYLFKTDAVCEGAWVSCPDVGNIYE